MKRKKTKLLPVVEKKKRTKSSVEYEAGERLAQFEMKLSAAAAGGEDESVLQQKLEDFEQDLQSWARVELATEDPLE